MESLSKLKSLAIFLTRRRPNHFQVMYLIIFLFIYLREMGLFYERPNVIFTFNPPTPV